jgi:hypothetical protein
MPGNSDIIVQQWGAFGAVFLLILLPLAAFTLRQTLKLNDVQNDRVNDAKQVATTVIAVIKDFSEAAREQVRSQTEQRAVGEHVVDTLSRVEARIESLENAVSKIRLGGGR